MYYLSGLNLTNRKPGCYLRKLEGGNSLSITGKSVCLEPTVQQSQIQNKSALDKDMSTSQAEWHADWQTMGKNLGA